MTADPLTLPTAPDHDQEDDPMTTDARARWDALEIRRPGDIPHFRPLTWLTERRSAHSQRLMNTRLPADFPHPVERGTAADALAGLALGEAVRRWVDTERASRVHEALTLGATWSEVAAALDVAPDDARTLLREWADGQHQLYEGDVANGRPRPVGLDAEGDAAVLALAALDDDQAAADAPTRQVEPQL